MALEEARRGDIVLLAGKGHEKTQTLKSGTIPFDDVAVALDALRGVAARGRGRMKLDLRQIAHWMQRRV